MAEAGFFYNVTTQKPDRSKRPSAHTNISIQSQAQPIKPVFKKSRSRSQSKSNTKLNLSINSDSEAPPPPPPLPGNNPRDSNDTVAFASLLLNPLLDTNSNTNFNYSSSNSIRNANPQESNNHRNKLLENESGSDITVGMLSTPLVDYKHAANQTNKARAAAEAKRKSLSTSGNSSISNQLPSSSSHKNASGVDSRFAPSSAQLRGAPPATTSTDYSSSGKPSSISSKTTTTGSSGLSKINSIDLPTTDDLMAQPFTRRNGRRYLRDPSLAYPLPTDLQELHRQTLRTMLLCQVFNGPTNSPAFQTKPPKRVLEVGCGTGFWSVMCHRHFSHKGHSSVQFTGLDIAPLAPPMDTDDDMNWRFVQHDLRRTPLPFRNEEFSLIMVKDMSLAISTRDSVIVQNLMDEYIRILKPGGTFEIWDGDHAIRMLLSHTPPPTKDNDHDVENHKQVHANAMGVYTITPQTPLTTPQNQYLIDYNTWIAKALDARNLPSMPCTSMRPLLLQESESLEQIESRRLAIPLGEVRWEREGVGVTSTTNGLSSAKGKAKDVERKHLTAGQVALRRTALMVVIQFMTNLEPVLKETSGKSIDEWDRWCGNMLTDLLKGNGSSWGECLEVGAWWARKKDPKADHKADANPN